MAATSVSAQSVEITSIPALGDVNGRVQGCVSGVTNVADWKIALFLNDGWGWYNKPSWTAPLADLDASGCFSIPYVTYQGPPGGDQFAPILDAYLWSVADGPVPEARGEYNLPVSVMSGPTFHAHHRVGRGLDTFGAYSTWQRKTCSSACGPGNNLFDPTLVSFDADGMHLQIAETAPGVWSSSEIVLREYLGHGTYVTTVTGPLADFDANAVLGAFTWEVNNPATSYRELDHEVAKWGDNTATTDAQFVVQPYDLPDHLVRYSFAGVPADPITGHITVTFVTRWTPTEVSFKTLQGAVDPANVDDASVPVVSSWTYPQAYYESLQEEFRFNLWLSAPTPFKGAGFSITINSFAHVPYEEVDCGSCGDGLCNPSIGESCSTCPQDCNGVTGGKPSSRFCCGGADGCGDTRCSMGNYICVDVPCDGGGGAVCGMNGCETGEDCSSCPADCGSCPVDCGDPAVCDAAAGETCADCAECCGSCSATDVPCSADGDCCSGSCRTKGKKANTCA